MDNHFNTPSEIIELNMKASETKTTLPLARNHGRNVYRIRSSY